MASSADRRTGGLMLRHANRALMFLLELAVYASVVATTWAATLGSGAASRVVLAVAAWAGAWAVFGAPKARSPLRGAGRAALEILWFGGAFALLAAAGHPVPAAVLGGLYLVSVAGRAVVAAG